MATFKVMQWEPEDLAGLSRRDRRGCEYRAYVPDPLVGRRFAFAADVAADIADAEREFVRLDHSAHALTNTEALARLLLRAESVASSRIEGLEVGARRLLRAEVARHMDDGARDVTASEVLANIDAMRLAHDVVENTATISLPSLLRVHERLFEGTRLEAHGGRLRTQQNWIGGSRYNPCTASFAPPPPERVPSLMEDLCAFCNEDGLPAVAQAAIAHAQFETIHPFVDGNGRVGRALIAMVLRRRKLTISVSPPISLVLATRADAYIAGLSATRYAGRADTATAALGYDTWIGTFAAACRRAALHAFAFEGRIDELQSAWRVRLGSVRADSALDLLLRRLPGAPVLTVAGAAAMIGRSVQATNLAMQRLEAEYIIVPSRIGKRNRIFEAREVVDAFTDLERQLASPVADTAVAPPSRPVPARPASRRRT